MNRLLLLQVILKFCELLVNEIVEMVKETKRYDCFFVNLLMFISHLIVFRNKTEDVKKENEDDDRAADLTANSHKRPASEVSLCCLCFPFSCSSDDQHLKGTEHTRPMCTSGCCVLF